MEIEGGISYRSGCSLQIGSLIQMIRLLKE